MTKNQTERSILAVQELLAEIYDREYSFEKADMLDVLPTPRDFRIKPKYRNLTKKWIKHFTLKIPDYVHFTGSFFYGTQATGKTFFSEQMCMIMNDHYQDKLIILKSKDMQAVIDHLEQLPYEEKDNKVFFIIIDDALTKHSSGSETKAAKKAAIALSIIRHYVDDEYDTSRDKKRGMRGIIYVNFNSQLFYFLQKQIRGQLKYRAYKSKSGSRYDNRELKSELGDDLFKLLERVDTSSEGAVNKMKHITIINMNGEVGFVVLDYQDKKKLVEIRKKIIYLKSTAETIHKKDSEITQQSNVPPSFWSRLKDIFIEELYNKKEKRRKDHLSIAKQVIGVSTLERNIRLWYLKHFAGFDNNALEEECKKLGTKGSARVTAAKTKNFLQKNNAFKGIISERFFLEKLRNSTVLPSLSFSSKNNRWFDRLLGSTHHPDIYLEREGKLVALLAVKMHFERETYNPSVEVRYAQHYQVPCYALIIDVCKTKAKLRAGKVALESEEKERKINTVELRSSWEEVEAMLKKDLLSKEED